MSEQPDLSTLPQRMRYSAGVLREADERYESKYSWSPDGLEIFAEKWEEEDQYECLTEELARKLFAVQSGRYPNRLDLAGWETTAGHRARADALALAEALIRDGWRKGNLDV